MKRFIPLIICCYLFSGCAVGMALSGKRDANIGSLQIGQDRNMVLLNLGQPSKTMLNEEGRVDFFDCQQGNNPSIGRALFHGVMDLLTYGAWEIIGTPMEALQGKSFVLSVQYDKEDKVMSVNTLEEGM